MIAQLEFNIDTENTLCLHLRVQTDNEIPLTHIQSIKLDADPQKALLKLFKTMPTLEFKEVTALASPDAITKIRTEEASKKASDEAVEGEIVG